MPSPSLSWLLTNPKQCQIETEYSLYLAAQNAIELTGLAKVYYAKVSDQAAHITQNWALQPPAGSGADYRILAESVAAMGHSLAANDDMNTGRLTNYLDGLQEALDGAAFELSRIASITELGFEKLHRDNLRQESLLGDVLNSIRNPQLNESVEIWEQGLASLKRGATQTGKFRHSSFRSALASFYQVVQNPVGKNDWSSWFQIGFLEWQLNKRHAVAEEAFTEAQRLMNPCRGIYVSCVRHIAQMQYLQGHYGRAYRTIQDAQAYDKSHDVLFDRARYAVRIGNTTEGISLLSECIRLRPATYVHMFAEKDFSLHAAKEIVALAQATWQSKASMLLERVDTLEGARDFIAQHQAKLDAIPNLKHFDFSNNPPPRLNMRTQGCMLLTYCKSPDAFKDIADELTLLGKIISKQDFVRAVAWLDSIESRDTAANARDDALYQIDDYLKTVGETVLERINEEKDAIDETIGSIQNSLSNDEQTLCKLPEDADWKPYICSLPSSGDLRKISEKRHDRNQLFCLAFFFIGIFVIVSFFCAYWEFQRSQGQEFLRSDQLGYINTFLFWLAAGLITANYWIYTDISMQQLANQLRKNLAIEDREETEKAFTRHKERKSTLLVTITALREQLMQATQARESSQAQTEIERDLLNTYAASLNS